jgi:hypothetical protein
MIKEVLKLGKQFKVLGVISGVIIPLGYWVYNIDQTLIAQRHNIESRLNEIDLEQLEYCDNSYKLNKEKCIEIYPLIIPKDYKSYLAYYNSPRFDLKFCLDCLNQAEKIHNSCRDSVFASVSIRVYGQDCRYVVCSE